jgi:hypothetical protein
MRRLSILSGALVIALFGVLALSPGAVSARSSIRFGGEPVDHFWNVDVTFCKDGFMVAAVEVVQPDGSTGDNLPFSLVLSRTSTLITTPLPNRIGGGIGGPDRQLASATVYYAYAAAQAPNITTTITLERWEHGDNRADDETGDNSPGDDRQVVSGTVANCTLVTPPEFDVPPSPTLGKVFTVDSGANLSFPVEASDADGLDAVTLGATGLLPGMNFASLAPANPAISTFSWTPAVEQAGAHTVNFTATDNSGRVAPTYSITINVVSKVYLPLTKSS